MCGIEALIEAPTEVVANHIGKSPDNGVEALGMERAPLSVMSVTSGRLMELGVDLVCNAELGGDSFLLFCSFRRLSNAAETWR
jgi:hypothetical protein